MKTTLLAVLLSLPLMTFGQNNPNSPFAIYVDFEYDYDTSTLSIMIDTANTANIWQIGRPQKNVFNQAQSQPFSIVTDTLNTYPVNNHSTFYVNYINYNCPYIEGYYYCDTDTADYGTIELSTDNGQTWTDLLTVTSDPLSRPVLSGNSNGWQFFSLDFVGYVNDLQIDSLIVRFSFISDSIDTQHDGLMYDDLAFCIAANTQNHYRLNELKVFPNPTSDIINFQFEESIEKAEIRIYTATGQIVSSQYVTNTVVEFDASTWSQGFYYYGIFVENEIIKQGQLLKQ